MPHTKGMKTKTKVYEVWAVSLTGSYPQPGDNELICEQVRAKSKIDAIGSACGREVFGTNKRYNNRKVFTDNKRMYIAHELKPERVKELAEYYAQRWY